MKIIFFGSEDFSLPAFEALHSSPHQVVAVVTQPDRKRGRGMKETPTPVGERASAFGIPLYKPEKLKAREFLELLKNLEPDIVVVCAYGRILNKTMLACPLKGCINIHPSLLPLYRGAMPIENAIMAGDTMTGVSIFYMDDGCDTGDIILQKSCPLEDNDTRGTLRKKLSCFAAPMIMEVIELIDRGQAPRSRQPEGITECTHCIGKEDTFIHWDRPPQVVRNFTRAYWPRPSAQTTFRGKILKVGPLTMTESENAENALPGTVVELRKNEGPVIKVREGCVQLTEVKPEGKKLMTAREFSLGYSPEIGELFGAPPDRQ
jgi:methionyl-tRNA formyltransferase